MHDSFLEKRYRKGHIKIYNNIEYVEGNTVHFTDGEKEVFDTIIAAIGYEPDFAEFMHLDKERLDWPHWRHPGNFPGRAKDCKGYCRER